MTTYIYLAQACAFLVVAHAIIDTRNLYTYPALFSIVYCFWFLPQLIELDRCQGCADVERTLWFSFLCFLATVLPWMINLRKSSARVGRVQEAMREPVNPAVLLKIAIVLAFVGLVAYANVTALARTSQMSQWTGPITIYWFFSQLLFMAGLISLFMYRRTKNRLYLLVGTLSLAVLLHRVLYLGRRAEALQLFFYLGLYFWFSYRRLPPRLFVVIAIPVAGLFIAHAGTYRAALADGTPLAAMSEVFSEALGDNNRPKDYRRLEALNAVSIIEDFSKYAGFTYHATFWNALVHRYIPAQMLGEEFKSSLQFGGPDLYQRLRYHQREVAHLGATITGFASSFMSLGLLGFLWFFLISYAMKTFYFRALAGSLFHQVLYAYMLSYSLHALTHDHYWFFTPFIQFWIFVGLPIYLARATARKQLMKRAARRRPASFAQ